MAWFKKSGQGGGNTRPQVSVPNPPIPDTDWADPESIRAEWRSDREPADWGNAMQMFEQDVPGQRFNVGEYLNRRLKAALFDPTTLDDATTAEACRRALLSLSSVPAEIDFLQEYIPRQIRLPLAIARDRGWQSVKYGGNGAVAVDLDVAPIRSAVATTRAPNGAYLDYFFGRC